MRTVTVITGGTRGLGRAIAIRRVRHGGHIALLYARDHERAQQTEQQLRLTGESISVHSCDIASAESITATLSTIKLTYGPVTHLVNNAGVLSERKPTELNESDWIHTLDVNLSAPFHMIQQVWPDMTEAGFGRIVNVSSVTAVMGNPRQVHYAAAKSGLIGLTRSYARAGARHGITVNCLVPGVFDTDMTSSMSERSRAAIAQLIPVGRPGAPDELARAADLFLSAHAGYITGAILAVDGGLSMGM